MPPLPSSICVTGKAGAPCGDDGWSRWSLLHWDRPEEENTRESWHWSLCLLSEDKFKSDITTAQSPSFNLFSSHGERGIEPLLESAATLENGGQEEVQQCPELRQLILQWSSCQEDSSWSQIVGVENLRQLTVVVFHTVAFIHNHVLPADLVRRQKRGVREDEASTALPSVHPHQIACPALTPWPTLVQSQAKALSCGKYASGLQHPPVCTVRKPIWIHESNAAWWPQKTNTQCDCMAAPRREMQQRGRSDWLGLSAFRIFGFREWQPATKRAAEENARITKQIWAKTKKKKKKVCKGYKNIMSACVCFCACLLVRVISPWPALVYPWWCTRKWWVKH